MIITKNDKYTLITIDSLETYKDRQVLGLNAGSTLDSLVHFTEVCQDAKNWLQTIETTNSLIKFNTKVELFPHYCYQGIGLDAKSPLFLLVVSMEKSNKRETCVIVTSV